MPQSVRAARAHALLRLSQLCCVCHSFAALPQFVFVLVLMTVYVHLRWLSPRLSTLMLCTHALRGRPQAVGRDHFRRDHDRASGVAGRCHQAHERRRGSRRVRAAQKQNTRCETTALVFSCWPC